MIPDTVEERLRSGLHLQLGDGPVSALTWDQIERAARRAERRRRRVAAVTAAVGVAALITVGVVIGVTPGQTNLRTLPNHRPTVPQPTTQVPTSALASSGLSPDAVLASADVGTSEISGIAVTSGAAWVALWGSGDVVRINDRGAITARVHLEGPHQGPLGIAAGEGDVWVLDFWASSLDRIDPASATVTGRLRLPAQPEKLTVGLGHVWVTVCCDRPVPNQRLVRIDLPQLTLGATVALPGQGESETVVAGAEGVWVSGELFSGVVHVDPTGTRQLGQAQLDGPVAFLALGAGSVWASPSGKGELLRMAPDVDRVPTDQAVLPLPDGDGGAALAFAGSILWAAKAGVLTGFETNGGIRAVTPIQLPGLGTIAANGSDLWVSIGSRVLLLNGGALTEGR